MDLLLDSNNDIVFLNGECPVTQDSAEIVAQRLSIRLKTYLGEWFVNTGYGTPWFQSILGVKTTKSAVDRILQEQILAENGVREITFFQSSLSVRSYSMEFRVKAVNLAESSTITINIGV